MLFQVMLPSWSDVSLQPVCKTPGRMFLRVVLNVLHWEKQILRYWPRNLKVLSGQVLVHTAQVDKAQLPWRPKDQSEVKAMSGNWKSQMRAGQPMWNSEAEAGQSRLQEADDRTKPSRLVWSHCLTSHPHLPRAGRGVSSLPREAGERERWCCKLQGILSTRSGSTEPGPALSPHEVTAPSRPTWQRSPACQFCALGLHPGTWWTIVLFHALLKKTLEWPVVYLNIYIVIQSAGSVTARSCT